MTSLRSASSKATADVTDAASVAKYLRQHPDFFNDEPEVLRDLEIAYTAAGAVSLLERQVGTLREERAQLKEQLDELFDLAKANGSLIRRIHDLALELMGAAGPEAIFSCLRDRLARDFNADGIYAFVFAQPAFVDADHVTEFVGPESALRAVCSELLAQRVPQCGSAIEFPLITSLAKEAPIGSAVLLPLNGKTWDGVVLIASGDETRFNNHMGTEFLAYLGDIITLIIDPWVARM